MIVFQLISIVRTQLLLKYQLKTVVKQFHTKVPACPCLFGFLDFWISPTYGMTPPQATSPYVTPSAAMFRCLNFSIFWWVISSMLCSWLPLQESPKHCKLCPLLLHLTHDLPLKEARPPNGTQCIEAAVFIMDQLLLRIRKDWWSIRSFGITSLRFLSLFLKTQQL